MPYARSFLRTRIDRLEEMAGAARAAHGERRLPIDDLKTGVRAFLAYGQSLSNGTEGWPALSRSPLPGNYMIGESVRPIERVDDPAGWRPVGGEAILRPLVATIQHVAHGALISHEDVPSLPHGAMHYGETIIEGALNYLRRRVGAAPDQGPGDGAFVAASCGVAGKTIEQLSKGGRPDLYGRTLEAIEAAQRALGPRSGAVEVSAILWLQGEFNYSGLHGGATARDEYAARVRELFRDLRQDLAARGVADRAPAVFAHQSHGFFSTPETDLEIAQAQRELAATQDHWRLVGPVYAVTAKGGHLDANGYRWLGSQFGKVMSEVFLEGRPWRPLSLIACESHGRFVLAAFEAPAPPIVIERPLAFHDAAALTSAGFGCRDARGDIAVRAADVVSPHVVALTLERAPEGPATLTYAGKRPFNGVGCLRDSDPALADDSFDFEAAPQPHLDPRVTARHGERYPLHNWCLAFEMPILDDSPRGLAVS